MIYELQITAHQKLWPVIYAKWFIVHRDEVHCVFEKAHWTHNPRELTNVLGFMFREAKRVKKTLLVTLMFLLILCVWFGYISVCVCVFAGRSF